MPGDTEYRTIGIIGVANISLLAVFVSFSSATLIIAFFSISNGEYYFYVFSINRIVN